ncbi:hypothetical protein ABBQ32_011112 [Trebouxia sp. C0010 RCD-2024]
MDRQSFSERTKNQYPEGDQAPVNDRLQAFKTKGMGFASFLKDKTVQASTQLKQKSTEPDAAGQTPYERVRLATSQAAGKVTSTAAVGGQWANTYFKRTVDTTAEGIRKLTGSTLASVCRSEANTRPCPRLVLVCCVALVTRGLETENLFLEEAPLDLVQFLIGSFQEGSGAVLPPAGTSPHVLANAIKHFLATMPEPLLTYKLLPLLIQHGSQQPALANLVIAELPAANHCTLQLLLETFHRLSGNAAVNEMDAHTVATVMTPCIAWNPPPKPKSSFSIPGMSSSPTAPQMTRTSSGRQISVAPNLNTVLEGDESGDGSPSPSLARIPLDDDDTHAIVRVLEHLIANYKQLSDAPNSPLYKGPRH